MVIRSLLALVLMLAVSGGAWAQCVSGDLTPEELACCVAMGHDCGLAMDMACCPTEAQTQNRADTAATIPGVQAPAPSPAPAVASLTTAPLVPFDAVSAMAHDREAVALPDRPAYLLLASLLI